MNELSEFFVGFRAAFHGVALAWRTPRVRRAYAAIAALALFIVLALDALGIYVVLHIEVPVSGTFAHLAFIAVKVAAILVVLVGSPFVTLALAHVLAPAISEHIFFSAFTSLDPERARKLRARPPLGTRTTVLLTFRRLFRVAAFIPLTFMLALVPEVGVFLAPLAQLAVSAIAVTWELLDPYFDKTNMSYDEQVKWTKEHRAGLLGFGLPFAFILAIPFIGPYFFGFAQAAAASFVHEGVDQRCDGTAPASES